MTKSSADRDDAQLDFDWLERARARLRLSDYGADALGVGLLALSLLTLLGLVGLTSGAWLAPWIELWRHWLGWGSVLVALALAFSGWRLLLRQRTEGGVPWAQVVALEVAAFAGLGLLSLIGGLALERAEMGLDGGLVGWGLAASLNLLLEPLLPTWLAHALGGLVFGGIALLSLIWGLGRMRRARRWLSSADARASYDHAPAISTSPAMDDEEPVAQSSPARRKPQRLPAEYRKDFKVDSAPAAQAAPINRDADLPGLDLLIEEKGAKPDEKHINHQAGLLEKTLAEFGIPARVVSFQVGPTVTQFAVEPGYLKDDPDGTRQKVRVSQISGLQRDLALALSAQRLRIQAPVPGRSYVGIEVPSRHSSMVRLRPILESQEFHKLDSALAIALGRDVSGTPLAADLSKMPHLLVAGTTGSGKSVLISAITICLAMNNSPADLRLIMLDPKMVELVRFNGLPHLIGQVETELERITAVLRWVVGEMQRRYKLLEEARARDLNGYNQKIGKNGETLPRIVVLIDELADLMMNAAEHTESTLVRLAQMARATGIHLVVATQRPSTDVVTGLIKANFPARISFAVASAIDSRVVLDSSGAEQLLGRGDMLYLAPEAANPKRSQGVMITDKEIDSVVAYWQTAWETGEADKAPWDEMIQKDAILGDRDDLIEDAIEEIRRSGKSSASHLQRALKVGYPRAARLVDELEDMGVLGPSLGGGREREILLDLDSFDLQEELEDEYDDEFDD